MGRLPSRRGIGECGPFSWQQRRQNAGHQVARRDQQQVAGDARRALPLVGLVAILGVQQLLSSWLFGGRSQANPSISLFLFPRKRGIAHPDPGGPGDMVEAKRDYCTGASQLHPPVLTGYQVAHHATGSSTCPSAPTGAASSPAGASSGSGGVTGGRGMAAGHSVLAGQRSENFCATRRSLASVIVWPFMSREKKAP